MDTHAAGGNSADDTFILQQGGHTGVHAYSESHTQDFIVTREHNFSLRANTITASNNVAITLASLGTRISHASVWQTYRINSVTFLANYALFDFLWHVITNTTPPRGIKHYSLEGRHDAYSLFHSFT